MKVGFAATTTLTVTAPAVALLSTVKTEITDPDPAPFLAIREIGTNQGKFVYTGDSNLFSNGGGGYYAGNDNDKLARNICGDINPPTITITTPQDGARYAKGANLPAAVDLHRPGQRHQRRAHDGARPRSASRSTRTSRTGRPLTKTFTVTAPTTSGTARRRP